MAFGADNLEAIHAQRIEWMKKRVVTPAQGIYQDFRAIPLADDAISEPILKAAKSAEVQILLRPNEGVSEFREGILVARGSYALPPPFHYEERLDLRTPNEKKRLRNRFKEFPDEVFDAFETRGGQMPGVPMDVSFRHTSTHILARELSAEAVQDSIERGRAYAAADWLCDPSGFTFIAENDLGAYEIGDTVPLRDGTRFVVNLPIPGSVSIVRTDNPSGEYGVMNAGTNVTTPVTREGSYRAVVTLNIGDGAVTWITTNPIRVEKRPAPFPMGQISSEVEVRKDVAYVEDGLAKHRLDLYLPRGKKSFPVMIFFHGGNWRTGDRSLYPLLGNRFAKTGIGVAIPSYRLMPDNPYPAQIEDAAAAFAWVFQNIARFGGDVQKIYIAGHSSGGHLASLLALAPEWLKKYDISPGQIHGVAALSGIYNVDGLPEFKNLDASPIYYIHPRTPPFLVSYCQWDYYGLAKQARDFAAALKKEFDDAKLVYIPGESHVSEIISTLRDDDATARALIDFIR
jgi:acetyl esterase/lipase